MLGLCSLHPLYKPLICALAPLGRIVDIAEQREEYIFARPAPDCSGVERNVENKLADTLAAKEQELHYEKRYYDMLYLLKDRISS